MKERCIHGNLRGNCPDCGYGRAQRIAARTGRSLCEHYRLRGNCPICDQARIEAERAKARRDPRQRSLLP